MNHLKLAALLALIIGCSQTGHLEVKSIDILPPGGDVDEITAYVDLQGAGIARLDWERRAYGMDSLVQTEYWYVDSSNVYTSTLSVADGWYWLSIYDEDSILLITSDVVFCGTGSQLPPIAKFYGEPTSGEAPLYVEFHDQSLNDPTAWLWDYGDGEDEYQWAHYYEEPGNYDVTLIVSNLAGVDTLTKKNYIQVELPDPPEAGFYAEPTEGDSPLYVKFYDQSSGGGTSYILDYGDGDRSSGSWPYHPISLPDHSYQVAGIYIVTLIVKNDWEADTMIREDYIHAIATGEPPVANFYAVPTEGESPLNVKFYNQSTSEGSLWCQWDFGDGGYKSGFKDNLGDYWHSYSHEGIFTVRLIVSDKNGRDTLIREDYIHVTEP